MYEALLSYFFTFSKRLMVIKTLEPQQPQRVKEHFTSIRGVDQQNKKAANIYPFCVTTLSFYSLSICSSDFSSFPPAEV